MISFVGDIRRQPRKINKEAAVMIGSFFILHSSIIIYLRHQIEGWLRQDVKEMFHMSNEEWKAICEDIKEHPKKFERDFKKEIEFAEKH